MDTLNFIKSKIFPYKPFIVKGYTFEKPFPQTFSFPPTLMKYITLNPSTPKVWKKLVKTCKYFYSKNPLVLCDHFSDGANPSEISIAWKWKFLTFKIDEIKFRIWLTDWIFLNDNLPLDVLTTKVYKNDAKQLYLLNMDVLFSDLNMIGLNGKLTNLHLYSVTVKDNENRIITVEEIAQTYSNLLFFSYRCGPNNASSITKNTAKRLLEIYASSTKLVGISLEGIPEQFDFQVIFDYITQKQPFLYFYLSFGYWGNNLSNDYMQRVKFGISQILAAKKTIFPFQAITCNNWKDDDLKPLYSNIWQAFIRVYKYLKIRRQLVKN